VALARHQPAEAQRVTGEEAPDLLGLLTSDAVAVRVAATSTMNAMVRYGLTDADVRSQAGIFSKLAGLVLDALKSVRYRASSGLPHLLTVAASLVSRARLRADSGAPVAAEVFKEHVEMVGGLRGNDKFEFKEKADEVLGMAVEVCGPAWVLDVLPLNIDDIRYDSIFCVSRDCLSETSADLLFNNSKQTTPGRAWLLPLLRQRVTNTRLGHFVTFFLPLSERLYSRAQEARNSTGRDVEAKVYEALTEQIWAILPGYCDLPTDLPEVFFFHDLFSPGLVS
jgi:ribosomal RNA-processing protein 12